MSRLLKLLDGRAAHGRSQVAISAPDGIITYGDLPIEARRYAARIRAADPGGRPVGIRLPNGPEWVLADLALGHMGRVAVPLPGFLPPGQAEKALADAGASAVIEPGTIRLLDIAAISLPCDVAKISRTSGATGAPKGIGLSEAQQLAAAHAVAARLCAGRAMRHLSVTPLAMLLENVAGLYACLIAGGTYLAENGQGPGWPHPCAPDFPALASRIQATRATSLILRPEWLRGLTAELASGGQRLPHLDRVMVAGAPVGPADMAAARAVGLPVIQGYGLTEAGSVVAIEDPDDIVRGTAGRALGHVRLGLAPDGEIIVHANDPMGLMRHPPIRTGDIGTLDTSGRLTVTGRK